MAMDIKVPSVGESVVEGVLARWIKKNGEVVKANEPLFELETDKATQEVAAPAGGVLQILVKEGEKVAIGSLVGRLDETGTTAAVAVANSPVVSVATGATGVTALSAKYGRDERANAVTMTGPITLVELIIAESKA